MSRATEVWEPPLPEFRVRFRLRGGLTLDERTKFLTQLGGEGPRAPEELEINADGTGWAAYAATDHRAGDRDQVLAWLCAPPLVEDASAEG